MQTPVDVLLHGDANAATQPIVHAVTSARIAIRVHFCVVGTLRSEPMFLTVKLATKRAAEQLIRPRATA